MATLEELQSRLEKLEATRATGVLTTEYDGRRVTYRSDAELVSAIASVKRQIAAAQSRAQPSCSFASFFRD